MEKEEFKIGDRVRIRPDSQYSEQCSEPGTVVPSSSSRGWINVDFDNGYQNSYPSEDLYLDVSPSVDQEFAVGDMIQITQGSENWDSSMDEYVGKIGSIKSVTYSDNYDAHIYKIDIDGGTWNWWPSKGHFIHAPQHGLDQKDELLYRAEQMFSVGTKFCPAHQVDENEIKEGTHCIITDNTSFEFDDSGNILAKAGGRRWFMSEITEYGNTSYDRVVYLARDKKWAYIYPKEKGFKVGDKVMITQSENNWCPEMDEFIGKIATLTKTKGQKGTHFGIDLDNEEWAWSDKDGHFRKPTEDELSDDLPTVKHKYGIGDKVMLTKSLHAVHPQEVTIRDYSESQGKPAYVLHTWSGRFPEDILSPIENHESEPKQDLLAMAFVRYPVGSEYRCATGGERIFKVEQQSFTLHDADTVYGEPGRGCLYKHGMWAEIVQVAVKHKFKVGDWVIGNHRANSFYSVTNEGWSGQVTNVRDSDGYIDVKGKYNDDNDHYLRLDPDRFDLTTEGELMALVAKPSCTLTATTTPASYTLSLPNDYIEKLRIDSSDSIGISQPIVQSTLRVKKVSFNRI